MNTSTYRRTTVAGLAAVALTVAGCSTDTNGDISAQPQVALVVTSEVPAPPTQVKLIGERDVEVTLTGPIAAKYASATDKQKAALGKPLTGDHNAGTRDSGVVFQQFQGGAIVAKNNQPGTPAYIIWGKIREAWNVQRDADGVPSVSGTNGSAGPLGVVTSDETPAGDQLVATFEHGKIAYNTTTRQVEVTVNGKVVPSGL
ncbi:LGFP repeat-containing protein [Mycobacterium sp. SMC-18]|uniref:LGFP repeat-containing protein n=1 Tax=Mycobacterium sp. SMC-18 TaxID=3381629 RepID=UPI003876CB31